MTGPGATRPTRWTAGGVLALLVALLIVGALRLVSVDTSDPEQITRARVGEAVPIAGQRVEVLAVETAPVVEEHGERIEVPGAMFVVVTVQVDALERQRSLLGAMSLRVAGKEYTPAGVFGVLPAADPGWRVTGQVGFVVPVDRAAAGIFAITPRDSLFTGFPRPSVHVRWSDPTPIALAGTVRPTVEPL